MEEDEAEREEEDSREGKDCVGLGPPTCPPPHQPSSSYPSLLSTRKEEREEVLNP